MACADRHLDLFTLAPTGAILPTRDRNLDRAVAGLNRGAVLMRIEVEADSEAEVRDEVESLMTDLRMLGFVRSCWIKTLPN